MSLRSLRPSASALEAGDILRDEVDIQRTVLEETIESARGEQILESGRTICGPNTVKPPLKRFPRSIQLQRCPIGATAIVHTHPSEAELRNPHHSLPDVANVIFDVDASMVVGVQSSELVFRADSPDAMHTEFGNAIGLDVDNTNEVVQAIKDGRISDPPAARERVRRAIDPLVERVPTPFPDLEDELEELDVPAQSITAACIHSHHVSSHVVVTSAPETIQEKQSQVAANIRARIRAFFRR